MVTRKSNASSYASSWVGITRILIMSHQRINSMSMTPECSIKQKKLNLLVTCFTLDSAQCVNDSMTQWQVKSSHRKATTIINDERTLIRTTWWKDTHTTHISLIVSKQLSFESILQFLKSYQGPGSPSGSGSVRSGHRSGQSTCWFSRCLIGHDRDIGSFYLLLSTSPSTTNVDNWFLDSYYVSLQITKTNNNKNICSLILCPAIASWQSKCEVTRMPVVCVLTAFCVVMYPAGSINKSPGFTHPVASVCKLSTQSRSSDDNASKFFTFSWQQIEQ